MRWPITGCWRIDPLPAGCERAALVEHVVRHTDLADVVSGARPPRPRRPAATTSPRRPATATARSWTIRSGSPCSRRAPQAPSQRGDDCPIRLPARSESSRIARSTPPSACSPSRSPCAASSASARRSSIGLSTGIDRMYRHARSRSVGDRRTFDGLELVRELRCRHRAVRVLHSTASPSSATVSVSSSGTKIGS